MSSNFQQMVIASSLMARKEGATIVQLEERLNISRRTAFRVIGKLQENGFELKNEPTLKGREVSYHLKNNHIHENVSLSNMKFTEEDDILFQILLQKTSTIPFLQPWVGQLVQNKLKSLAQSSLDNVQPIPNVEGKVPVLIKFNDIARIWKFEEQDFFLKLMKAIADKNVCRVSYLTPFGRESHIYEIYPLCCFAYESVVYCYGIICQSQQLVILALDRIESLAIEGKTSFVPEKDYDSFQLLQDPFGIVLDSSQFTAVVKLSKEEGWSVRKRIWPESVMLEEQGDGTELFTVTTRGRLGLKRWVLKLGDSATLLSPAWLRSELVLELDKARANY
ncbi:MAG: WYL domain-containing transcriptional regulator [Sphaerochaetaceae bacterium]